LLRQSKAKTDLELAEYYERKAKEHRARAASSKFNDAISTIKPEKRVADTKGNKEAYEYMLSTDRKKAEFIRRIKGQ